MEPKAIFRTTSSRIFFPQISLFSCISISSRSSRIDCSIAPSPVQSYGAPRRHSPVALQALNHGATAFWTRMLYRTQDYMHLNCCSPCSGAMRAHRQPCPGGEPFPAEYPDLQVLTRAKLFTLGFRPWFPSNSSHSIIKLHHIVKVTRELTFKPELGC